MSEYFIQKSTLTTIADAIREKTGGTTLMTPEKMATEIINIQSGGDDERLKAVIERTVTNRTFPNNLTKIGSYGFSDCTNLSLTSLPSGVTSIDAGAFQNCTNLALTSLPSGVTSIGSYTFHGCTNLSLTSLPPGVTSIGASAFGSCRNLSLTSLPSEVTSISHFAFGNCTGLTTITFEGTPTGEISMFAFYGCTNLITINVPWAKDAVANAPWGATNATINYNYTGS